LIQCISWYIASRFSRVSLDNERRGALVVVPQRVVTSIFSPGVVTSPLGLSFSSAKWRLSLPWSFFIRRCGYIARMHLTASLWLALHINKSCPPSEYERPIKIEPPNKSWNKVTASLWTCFRVILGKYIGFRPILCILMCLVERIIERQQSESATPAKYA